MSHSWKCSRPKLGSGQPDLLGCIPANSRGTAHSKIISFRKKLEHFVMGQLSTDKAKQRSATCHHTVHLTVVDTTSSMTPGSHQKLHKYTFSISRTLGAKT